MKNSGSDNKLTALLQDKINELIASSRNFEAIINTLCNAIVVHNKIGDIITLNDQAKKLFNINDRDEAKINMKNFYSDENDSTIVISSWNNILKGRTEVFECNLLQRNSGKKIPVEVSVSITDWDNEIVLVSVFRDLTNQKKHEHELISARKKAEKSDRLKSSFLANLSHEIRTPMNAILGFTNFLRKPDLDADKREAFVSIIHESGKHLLSILDEVIEISKIETGQIIANICPVNINECLNDLFKTMEVTIPKDKDISLLLKETDVNEEFIILTDKVKLCQILSNLINNAIKYTEKGSVTISYNIIYKENKLEFSVEDTGEGIEEKYHDIIFDRFSRLDSELSVKMGGSGLGLAISKAYVEMLGGTIKLESVPKKGSVFSFTIPMVLSDKLKEEKIPEYNMGKISGNNELILIAEDDDINYLFFEKLFQDKNFRIQRAKNGKEAVDAVIQNNSIALVLMDIKMPVISGVIALKLIKKLNSGLPVIAQTAHAIPDEQRDFENEGFDAYLTKPINEEILFRTIHKLLQK